MPCNSDYLDPTNREAELQRAAKLLVYVYEKLNLEVPSYVKKASKDVYCKDDRSVSRLCSILDAMPPDTLDRIVYNAKNKTSRDLADWWEEHQQADREREVEEDRQKQQRYEQYLKLKEEFEPE